MDFILEAKRLKVYLVTNPASQFVILFVIFQSNTEIEQIVSVGLGCLFVSLRSQRKQTVAR